MTETFIKKKLTEKEDLERQLRGFENLQSWMLESDEKADLKRIKKRLEVLNNNDK